MTIDGWARHLQNFQQVNSRQCVGLFSVLICAHQLHSRTALDDEAATEAEHRGEDGAHDIQPSK